MHRALTLVSEVLQEIFANLNQIPSYTDGRSLSHRYLAALARTCKTFYEPAMDLLWSDMDGLEPLLGCVTRLHPMIYGGTKVSLDKLHKLDVLFLITSSTPGLKESNHYLSSKPVNSCVMPPACAHCAYQPPNIFTFSQSSPSRHACSRDSCRYPGPIDI